MIFKSIIVIALLIIFKVHAKNHVASNFAVSKNCEETNTIRTLQYVPYEDTDDFNDGYIFGKSKTRVKYRYESIEINQTKAICCDGYQNYDDKQCIPVCTKSCGSEGICSMPEYCICNEGYIFDSNSQKCKPLCSLECTNGFCMSPDLCSCYEGYRMADDNHTCEPMCGNQTHSCTSFEFCAEPGVCRCIQGYGRELLDRQFGSDIFESCKPICDRICINGECILPNICKCHGNYTEVDQFSCERLYIASNFLIRKNCSETKTVKRKIKVAYEEYKTDSYEDNSYEDDEYISYYGIRGRRPTRTVYKTEYMIMNETTSICCDGYQNYDEQNCLPVCSRKCGPHGICSKPDTCMKHVTKAILWTISATVSECINGQCTSPNSCTCNEGHRKFSDDFCTETWNLEV